MCLDMSRIILRDFTEENIYNIMINENIYNVICFFHLLPDIIFALLRGHFR
jgi:hypothetical protein